MQRKLYLLTLLIVVLCQPALAWVSSSARIGSQEVKPYISSNPKVELKETRTLNQEQAFECYMFSFVGALEAANRNAWGRAFDPEISAEALFVEKLMAWSQEVLLNNSTLDDSFYFLDGGDIHHAMKLSVERGLISQKSFRPAKPFSTWDFPVLYKDIKSIVKEGRRAISRTEDQGIREEYVRVILKQVAKRLSKDAGVLPTQFSWNGKDWTPQKFENSFGIKRNSHIYMLYPGKWDMGDPWDLRKAILGMVETFKGAFNYKKASWAQIWNYIAHSLDQGLPVTLSVKWAGTYHVLNAVGYEYNNQNEIVSLKLQNTWGDWYGTKGFAYFSPDDIEKNVTTVWGFSRP